MLPCGLKIAAKDILSEETDGIVFVSSKKPGTIGPDEIRSVLKKASEIDDGFTSSISVLPIELPARRLIFSPISSLTDYDDVRIFSEAASKGIERAVKAGVKKPLLILPCHEKFQNTELVTLLGALRALYVPIQVREDVPEKKNKVEDLYVWGENRDSLTEIVRLAGILELGLGVARDIGGGDPERMAAPRIEEYVRNLFDKNNSPIKMEVISDENVLEKEYPCFAAVNRAASVIERHRGRIIYLRYEPEGEITSTLGLVGKGITYDTGGADVKVNGKMAGMSRDKCGAADVAGFMQIVSLLKPKGIRIIGALCLARNSIGENGYVADEVIIARSKARVRIGNTDAEGRMAMADVLCKVKEEVINYKNVHLMTVATLTSHAILSTGPYPIIMDNPVAQRNGNGPRVQKAGTAIGDPLEVSILRREDIAFHKGKAEGDDVVQCITSSSKTVRGHQCPAGFLILTSGLDQHGLTSSAPLSYSHIDIGGAPGQLPNEPKGASVLALASAYLMEIR